MYGYIQGLNWDVLCGGGALWYRAYIYIYIKFSRLFYPKRLTNEDNGNIYVLCVCVCFANMIYSNAIFSTVFYQL